ncbi:hypothetical protein F652_2673 [Enterobacteriaceae bacterium bta3-1]|nr:hypothetical protein F652_2673 [Enterobacteriaceae bacterium bta3-1]
MNHNIGKEKRLSKRESGMRDIDVAKNKLPALKAESLSRCFSFVFADLPIHPT